MSRTAIAAVMTILFMTLSIVALPMVNAFRASLVPPVDV
jgi:hypothetical protein